MPEVYFSFLSERNGAAADTCYMSHILAATQAGKQGYHPILFTYGRTDTIRNRLVDKFMELSRRDDDLLVMMDGDHKYPDDIVQRFASEDPKLGVVGALAYRRGEPYDALWFVRGKNMVIYSPVDFPLGGIHECMMVSTSAISIRRWVFVELERKGYLKPYFRYEYPVGQDSPSEDTYFGLTCERAGIAHHVDTSIIIPHAAVTFVDQEVSSAFINAHPERLASEQVMV